MIIKRHRDLTLIDINKEQKLVISCDSSGGIGEKENDIVKTSPEFVGYCGTHVALMEIMAFGVRPSLLVNTLSVEMDNTGLRIIEGIKQALKPLNLEDEIIITGSTEENFPVSVTGLGITVIGIIDKSAWKKPQTKSGMIAVVVGIPKVGDEVLEDQGQIMDIGKLIHLREKDYIGEILPVGSKGIGFELKEMAKYSDLDFILQEEISIDLEKSGGPSTCVIVSIENDKYELLKKESVLPINKIGEFINKLVV